MLLQELETDLEPCTSPWQPLNHCSLISLVIVQFIKTHVCHVIFFQSGDPSPSAISFVLFIVFASSTHSELCMPLTCCCLAWTTSRIGPSCSSSFGSASVKTYMVDCGQLFSAARRTAVMIRSGQSPPPNGFVPFRKSRNWAPLVVRNTGPISDQMTKKERKKLLFGRILN